MNLLFVLDEHLRGTLWRAIWRHNALGVYPIDVVRVGDPPGLPLGSADPDILIWAEREGQILSSRDRDTMIGHLADHLAAGRHSPGVFVVRPHTRRRAVVDFLAVAAYASQPEEWTDAWFYIP